MRFPLLAAIVLIGAASFVPPDAVVVMKLPDQSYLHMLPMPMGRLDGAVKGTAKFDDSGTRAVFVATFPGATLAGNWRSLDPQQAFELDASRRTLTQLSSSGKVLAVAWVRYDRVAVTDEGGRHILSVAPRASTGIPSLRMTDSSASGSSFVAQGGDGRFTVTKSSSGRYAIEQVGARALRFEGIARNGAYALVGDFLVWVDRSRDGGPQIARAGNDDFAPPSFAGSALGNAVVPIIPLGHSVYQGAYRNGTAYFAFTYGVRRIVAQTSDFINYTYPLVPNDLSYTVGDGFGADANGDMYFGRPESDEVTFWRARRWVHEPLHFPDDRDSVRALDAAMQRVAPADPLYPPLRPDEDALDTALLQWRLYPVGDAVGERWIASYLGRVLVSDARGNFHFVGSPQFPFAVLGRTDDGRLWGASPLARGFSQGHLRDTASALWWTRDGLAWLQAGQVPGDAGAIGLDHRRLWIALTHPWMGRASIAVMRLGDTSAATTGGTYRGEQLFFAGLPGGFSLVWGATPGRRLGSDQGPLSAYRIDPDLLFGDAGDGRNVFAKQIEQPLSDPSLPSPAFPVQDGLALLAPSLSELALLEDASRPILVTNISGAQADPRRIIVLAPDQARVMDIKYAGVAYPRAVVIASLQGNDAKVVRSLQRGPLDFAGSVERWSKSSGTWRQLEMTRFGSQR